MSLTPACDLLRMLTEISSGVSASTKRAVSSAPALTGRRPGIAALLAPTLMDNDGARRGVAHATLQFADTLRTR